MSKPAYLSAPIQAGKYLVVKAEHDGRDENGDGPFGGKVVIIERRAPVALLVRKTETFEVVRGIASDIGTTDRVLLGSYATQAEAVAAAQAVEL